MGDRQPARRCPAPRAPRRHHYPRACEPTPELVRAASCCPPVCRNRAEHRVHIGVARHHVAHDAPTFLANFSIGEGGSESATRVGYAPKVAPVPAFERSIIRRSRPFIAAASATNTTNDVNAAAR